MHMIFCFMIGMILSDHMIHWTVLFQVSALLCTPEAVIKGWDKLLHPIRSEGCNHLSLSLLPASGTHVVRRPLMEELAATMYGNRTPKHIC